MGVSYVKTSFPSSCLLTSSIVLFLGLWRMSWLWGAELALGSLWKGFQLMQDLVINSLQELCVESQV